MKTTTFATTTSYVAVTASIWTKRVIISEDPSVANWPTTDFLIKAPETTNTPIRRVLGTSFVFESDVPFPAGKVVGYVANVTGSTTFQQLEDGL